MVTSGIQEIHALAVDWIGRNVYWSDAGFRRIEVATIDGRARTVLFQGREFLASAIVVDPRSGYV